MIRIALLTLCLVSPALAQETPQPQPQPDGKYLLAVCQAQRDQRQKDDLLDAAWAIQRGDQIDVLNKQIVDLKKQLDDLKKAD